MLKSLIHEINTVAQQIVSLIDINKSRCLAKANIEHRLRENMGIECYGVSLISSTATVQTVTELLLHRPHVLALERHPIYDGLRFEYHDGMHLVEMLLNTHEEGCTLDIRFALSNHSSIDAIFLDLTKSTADLMAATIWPMNVTPAIRSKIPFPPDGLYFTTCETEIEALRSAWLKIAGPSRGPVSVDRAWDNIPAFSPKTSRSN